MSSPDWLMVEPVCIFLTDDWWRMSKGPAYSWAVGYGCSKKARWGESQ